MLKLILILIFVLFSAALVLVYTLVQTIRTRNSTDAILALLKTILRSLKNHTLIADLKSRIVIRMVKEHLDLAYFFTFIIAALTLVILSLAIVVIFFLEARPNNENTVLTQIHRVLSERLPPGDLQSQRHQELVTRLDGIRERTDQTISTSITRTIVGTLTVLLLLLSGGLLAWVWLPKLCLSTTIKSRAVASVVFVAPLTVLFFPGAKAVLFDKIAETLFQIDIRPGTDVIATTKIDMSVRPLADTTLECDPTWVVGTFRGGESSALESGADIEVVVSSVMASIFERYRGRKAGALVFVGSADVRPLSGNALQTFGSNTGLAQARAIRVKHIAEAQSQLPLPTLLAVPVGPASTVELAKLPRQERVTLMDRDRSVQVCALWAQ